MYYTELRDQTMFTFLLQYSYFFSVLDFSEFSSYLKYYMEIPFHVFLWSYQLYQ